MKTTLIWGASGGIGSEMVRILKNDDWRVFAAARNKERIPAEADEKLYFDTNDISTLSDKLRAC